MEVGSGTGQHAVYFAERLPYLVWHTSDRLENHNDIQAWLDEACLSNTRSPIPLDTSRDSWPNIEVDGVFSANTAHIMHWTDVKALFSGVGALLLENGLFVLYGPFNYNNEFTSESNAQFELWLKSRDPCSGIRNFQDLDQLANKADMVIREDIEMPANNRILCWKKQA